MSDTTLTTIGVIGQGLAFLAMLSIPFLNWIIRLKEEDKEMERNWIRFQDEYYEYKM